MRTLRQTGGVVLGCALVAAAFCAVAGSIDALYDWGDGGVSPAAWPHGTAQYVQAAAIGVTLVIGIVSMLGVALTRLRAPRAGVTERELERLVFEARTDTLTRLANRRAFNDDLAAEVERRNRTGSAFSLMALDLDGLKEVNDSHGHQAGDAHLRSIAQRLEAEVGSHGRVYRTGGDEFMVLLPGSRALHAMELAHRIQRTTTSQSGRRTLSIGVTETRGTEHRLELVRQADLALYEAKREKLPAVPYRPELEVGEAAAAVEALSPRHNTVAKALARAVAVRDRTTGEHSELVAELAVAVGAQHGIGGRRLERLRMAALLHDVGKIAVPDAILKKCEALATDERLALRQHVSVGRDLLAAAGFAEEGRWVLHHHERYDGSGYPSALRGDEIPLEARIIAVADAFEAMTGSRPYRERMTTAEALVELAARSGVQFDPACVDALSAVVGPKQRVAGAKRRVPASRLRAVG